MDINLPCTLVTRTGWPPSRHLEETLQSQNQLRTKHQIWLHQNLSCTFPVLSTLNYNQTQNTAYQFSIGSLVAVDRIFHHHDSAIYSVALGPDGQYPSHTMPSLLPLENKVLFSRFQAIIAFVPANNSETNTESLPS